MNEERLLVEKFTFSGTGRAACVLSLCPTTKAKQALKHPNLLALKKRTRTAHAHIRMDGIFMRDPLKYKTIQEFTNQESLKYSKTPVNKS